MIAEEPGRLPLSGLSVGREDETMCMLAGFFNSFSNPTRLSILLILTCQGETRVCDLVEQLKVPQPRISDHLQTLYQYGHVKARREGHYVYYSVADERAIEMVRFGKSLMDDNRARIEEDSAAESDR